MALQHNKESGKLMEAWRNILKKEFEKSTQTKKPAPETIKKSSSQPAQVSTYGDMIATKNGIEVTDVPFHKPAYLYLNRDKGYFISYTPLEGHHKIGTWKTIRECGPHTTYGDVCEAIQEEQIEISKREGLGPYNLGWGGGGLSFMRTMIVHKVKFIVKGRK